MHEDRGEIAAIWSKAYRQFIRVGEVFDGRRVSRIAQPEGTSDLCIFVEWGNGGEQLLMTTPGNTTVEYSMRMGGAA